MAFEKNEDEIGALWMKHGSKGEYMTGTILGQPVVVFDARSKSPKGPSWRVLKARPRDAQRPTPDDIGGGFTQDSEDPLGF
jgi:hypothetical protein